MVSQTTDGSSTRANAGSSTQEVDGVNHDDVLDSPTTYVLADPKRVHQETY